MEGWSPKKGAIIVDGQQVAETLQCVHCGLHWILQRGSGIVRGYCLLCKAVTCGADVCNIHAPVEERLAFTEAMNVLDMHTIEKLSKLYPGIQPL